MSTNLYVGTSGYSYKEWKGNFYPEKLSPKEMLKYYAQKLPSVEINNTFYRMPNETMLQTWAEQVPADFRFSLKASRRITHIKRLKDTDSETEYLLRTTATLAERLGVILFQLPPFSHKDIERLRAFLALLPEGTRAAFEFRHESWFDDEVYDLLRSRDLALCVADTDDADTAIVSTAKWGYLRLRRPGYKKSELKKWATDILAQQWSDAFVFFKHEDEGAGPKMAADFLKEASKLA